MLTYAQLTALDRSLRDERVLSVYLHGAADDPAARLVWRRELDKSLRDLRRWLTGAPHDEREQFEQCVTHLERRLAPYAKGLASPGWVGFITSEMVHDSEELPVPMTTMAIWSTGLCAAPYIRALKVTRPVIVAVADATAVRLYRYCAGILESLGAFHAHATIDAPAHMGDAPRAGFHVGVHGETAHDAAQRAHAAATERMLKQAENAIIKRAGRTGWVVVGGTANVSARVTQALTAALPDRVLHVHALDVHSSHGAIATAAQSGASALRNAHDLRRVMEIIDADGERGLSTVGPDATGGALERSCVRELYLTQRFVVDHTAEAEEAVRRAFDQRAVIEHVSGEAAVKLDEHGGVGARLRYRLASVVGAEDDIETAPMAEEGVP